jgi:hypothetical protein
MTDDPIHDVSPACEQACEDDRAYFAAHPGTRSYVQRRIAGEFPAFVPIQPGYQYVLVTQLAPGVRTRQPVRPVLLPDMNAWN